MIMTRPKVPTVDVRSYPCASGELVRPAGFDGAVGAGRAPRGLGEPENGMENLLG
jgi:hypothetical protein